MSSKASSSSLGTPPASPPLCQRGFYVSAGVGAAVPARVHAAQLAYSLSGAHCHVSGSGIPAGSLVSVIPHASES